MESNSPGSKKFKVSILLMKRPRIHEDKKKSVVVKYKSFNNKKGVLSKSKPTKSQRILNFLERNNYSIMNFHGALPKSYSNSTSQKNCESEFVRNMKVQTKNERKTFRTPYQIFQLKNKIIKRNVEFSKKFLHDFFFENEVNNDIYKRNLYSENENRSKKIKKYLLSQDRIKSHPVDNNNIKYILKKRINNKKKKNFSEKFHINNNKTNKFSVKEKYFSLKRNFTDLYKYKKILNLKLI